MSPLDQLFEQFLRERRYLKNVTPDTIEWYQTAWDRFRKARIDQPSQPSDLTRAHLESFVVALRDRGIRPVTCNTWIKALNAFARWLNERGETLQAISLRPLKVEHRLVKTLDHQAIQALVSFRPRGFAQWRSYALACALLDTGCRIQELLTARSADFDFDDLLVTVVGKGDKQRRIPFSVDLRRILFRYQQQRAREAIRDPLMFPARSGGSWEQRNALRSFYLLQDRLHLPRVGFHRLRHTFATEYLRNGGDVVRLSRTLGHTQITTTMRYVQMLTADLQVTHAQVSPLRLRGRRERKFAQALPTPPPISGGSCR